MGLSHPDSDTLSPLLPTGRFTNSAMVRCAESQRIAADNRLVVNFPSIVSVNYIAGTVLDLRLLGRTVFEENRNP